ncbi:hypothetical protein LX36DRAFT_385324 [Colletotrichum falcatum]|nr:hypothetical protein LX36DRAFT_385324 [Colletotrichum falcatum]
MLGLSSSPISTIPPLNTIPTLHSPSASIWQFFSFSSITNCTRPCTARACACSSGSGSSSTNTSSDADTDTDTDTTTTTTICRSRTTTLPSHPLPVESGIVAATIAILTTTFSSTKTSNHALRPLQPPQLAIGRIASACIENTTAVQAKAKGAARATVAASAASCWSCTCTILHSFVRVPTRQAANLIALLREPTLAIRRYPLSNHTRSPSLSIYSLSQRPFQSSLSLLSPSPSLPLKEALATSKSLAQALLQSPLPPPSPPRQDTFSTVPRKAVVLAAAFVEPFLPRLPTRQTRLCHRPP